MTASHPPGPSTTDRHASATRADAPPTRNVLVVGDALAARLRAPLSRCAPEASVEVVPGFLYAMGAAAQGWVDVVIGEAADLTGMSESAARSLRELLPAARLVVVADGARSDEAAAAVRGGFDAQLAEPMRDEALRAALGDGSATGEAAVHANAAATHADRGDGEPGDTGAHGDDDADADAHEPDEASAGDDPASLATDERPDEQADERVDEQADDTRAADATTPEQPIDVDLIQTVLTDRHRMTATALNLIAQRTGLDQVDYAQAAAHVPTDHANAAVAYDGARFGYLHAPGPATTAQLEPWAHWLAHWLTLGTQLGQLESMAMRDELTGAWNRRYFNRFLERILAHACEDRSQVTLLVFDIDDFKCYNDRYGHAAGDEILQESARLMQSFVRDHDVVARIGGEEVAVIFWDAEAKRRPDSAHPHSVRQAAQRFQAAICAHRFPKLLEEAPGTLTISGGLASFPWDGGTAADLLERADAMAMQSKQQGKNAITFGPGAQRACEHPPDTAGETSGDRGDAIDALDRPGTENDGPAD